MEVIGAKFEPLPDGEGGVDHEVVGFTTIDLDQLKGRFKKFNLSWPDVDIRKLQRLRNSLEHYHLQEPVGALKESIASSFPMVIDFFETLKEDPQDVLSDVWETILEETDAFNRVQKSCIASIERLNWPGEVSRLDRMACPNCGSSLIGQADRDNDDSGSAVGKGFQCGEEFTQQQLAEMVVEASYEVDAYYAMKDGESSPVATCPECWSDAYVENGEISICFACKESVAGECSRCSTDITVHEYNSDYPDLCSYCAHTLEKVMRE